MLPIVVVDLLQEVRNVRDDVGHSAEPAPIDLFVLERLHDALRVRIIVRIARPRHRAQ